MCQNLGPSGPLRVSISFVNRTAGHRYGDFAEEMTGSSLAEAFAALRREYGGHVSRVFVESTEGPLHVGWTFSRRVAYEDREDTYLRETWATFFRDAVCPCCASVAGRWRVTVEDARKLLAETVAA